MDRAVAVILVEGVSDKAAIEALALRRGRDLETEGVMVVAMGGASRLGEHLRTFGPGGSDLTLAGLCDLAEEDDFARVLDRANLGPIENRDDMERHGFFVCVADLEEELIRALGGQRVLEVVESEGELGTFRLFQNQPAWRGRDLDSQLRRFLGTFSGRKTRYGALLVEALELDRVPRPLDQVLTHVAS